MPIKVLDYTWSETEDSVEIVVPLKGVRGDKADIYTDDVYIKVNFRPYIFEVDLLNTIDDHASTAVIGNGTVKFSLVKTEPGLWGTLKYTGDRQDCIQRRIEAQERSRDRAATRAEEARLAKGEAERQAVRRQMDREAEEREKIKDRKDAVKRDMASEVDKLNLAEREAHKSLVTSATISPASTEAVATRSSVAASSRPSAGGGSSDNGSGASLPVPVRSSGRIEVTFTARQFKTPLRETGKIKEDEWLAQQAAARKEVERAKASKPGDVDNDPLWYSDRGKKFFAQADYRSAVNAFTAGLALDEKSPALYSNRAAAHIKLQDFWAGAQDTSKALSLLQPPVPANHAARLRAHTRRGAALSALEDYESAMLDYKEALRLSPNNEAIQADIVRVARLMAKRGTTPVSTVVQSE
eukprot:UC1_evm1s1244